MKENERTYIECRLFVIGEKGVGKHCFIERILNTPSSSTIVNEEAEEKFRKRLIKFIKKLEEEAQYYRLVEQEKMKQKIVNITKKENELLKSITTGSKNNTKSSINNTDDSNKLLSYCSRKDLDNKYIFKKIEEFQKKLPYPHRPPYPENPAKIFSFEKIKIAVKPFYIFPAEKFVDYYSEQGDDEEFDFNFGEEEKKTVKGIIDDINEIFHNINKKSIVEYDQISGHNIKIYNIFLFLYDMSNFDSFKQLSSYYEKLEKYFTVSDSDNFLSYIIGNKSDSKILLKDEEKLIFDDFINKNNLKSFEISTKPYFNFEKFISNLFSDMLSKITENVSLSQKITNDLEYIINTKSKFPKAERTSLYSSNIEYPGPEYDLNIYSFSSNKELEDVFNRKKNIRFIKKIFVNKQGPVYPRRDKFLKEDIGVDDKEKSFLVYISQSNGGLYNKPIKGYTLGVKDGKLNLIKSRKELSLQRSKSIIESIQGYSTLPYRYNEKNIKIKGQENSDEVNRRMEEIKQKKKLEKIRERINQEKKGKE